MASFSDQFPLGKDGLFQVLSYLDDIRDITSAERVCKDWHEWIEFDEDELNQILLKVRKLPETKLPENSKRKFLDVFHQSLDRKKQVPLALSSLFPSTSISNVNCVDSLELEKKHIKTYFFADDCNGNKLLKTFSSDHYSNVELEEIFYFTAKKIKKVSHNHNSLFGYQNPFFFSWREALYTTS